MATRRRKVSKAAVLERVRFWRSQLHLDDWEIGVVVDALPEEDDAVAACAAEPGYRRATIYVDPYQLPKADLNATCLHECLHCLVEELAALAMAAAGDDPMRKQAVTKAEEELVTRLERIIGGLVPSRSLS